MTKKDLWNFLVESNLSCHELKQTGHMPMIGSLMIYLSQLMKLNIDQEKDNSKKILTYLTFFLWTDLIISGVYDTI